MTTKITALDELILAVVAALTAANLGYPVVDGPPSKKSVGGSLKYVCIFATEAEDQNQADDAAMMEATIYGLGQVAREERLSVKCVAGAKASTVAAARSQAVSVVTDVGKNLPKSPTAETYGCFVSAVDSAKPHNMAGGAVVTVQFTISATARLT